jgi:hypothetical protein
MWCLVQSARHSVLSNIFGGLLRTHVRSINKMAQLRWRCTYHTPYWYECRQCFHLYHHTQNHGLRYENILAFIHIQLPLISYVESRHILTNFTFFPFWVSHEGILVYFFLFKKALHINRSMLHHLFLIHY